MKKILPLERRGGCFDRRTSRGSISREAADYELITAMKIVLSHPLALEKFCGMFAELMMRGNAEHAGETVYIPKKSGEDEKERRNKKIIKKFTGNNFADLGKEFKLSQRQIRNICCKK